MRSPGCTVLALMAAATAGGRRRAACWRRRRRETGTSTARGGRVRGAALAASVALFVACAPGAPGGGVARSAVLYVADAHDGTLARLDGTSGRLLGPALPAGPTPAPTGAGALTRPAGTSGRLLGPARPAGPGSAQVAAAHGAALVLLRAPTATAGPGDTGLTYVAPNGAGSWTARVVALEPEARVVLLAGDGGTTPPWST